jgi:hypothetical protein
LSFIEKSKEMEYEMYTHKYLNAASYDVYRERLISSIFIEIIAVDITPPAALMFL